MRVRWWLCLAGLLCTVARSSPAAPTEPIAAGWEGEGLRFELRMGKASDLDLDRMPAGVVLLVGIVGTPVLAVVQPMALIGMPVFLVVAPALQAQFNAQRETLERVLAADSPAPAIVDAVRGRWLASAVRPPASAQLSIVGYGLAARSGKTLEALQPAEPLCLVTAARLDWQHEGAQARSERLVIGMNERSPDAPPPLCMHLERWAGDDGAALRKGLRELGTVLGAMSVERIAVRP